MTLPYEKKSIYLSTIFSEQAEQDLILDLLVEDFFKSPWVQRRVASYPYAIEKEKDILILELMEHFWTLKSNGQLFSVFRDFDKVFTILGKKGHFIHQFEVFLMGWHLIRQLLNIDKNRSILSKFRSIKRLFYCWLFTSSAHDFGYSLQVANELAKKISNLYEKIHMQNLAIKYLELSEGINIETEYDLCFNKAYNASTKKFEKINIHDFILEGIEASIEGNRDDAKNIQKYLIENVNHGYISAMIFCRTYIDFLSESKKWKLKSEEWRVHDVKIIAGSIALHAIPVHHKTYLQKISFMSNPLVYLLILVDNLQEWNRTLRPSDEWPSYNLIDFTEKPGSISLRYALQHENWTKRMQNVVKKSLTEKAKLISLPAKPNPLLNFEVSVHFSTNCSYKFDPIFLRF